MKTPWRKRRTFGYVPLECQVHTCKRPSMAYCSQMYIFVCQEHCAEFCIPDKHPLHSLEEGLRASIADAESCARASRSAAEKYDRDAENYRLHLKYLESQ